MRNRKVGEKYYLKYTVFETTATISSGRTIRSIPGGGYLSVYYLKRLEWIPTNALVDAMNPSYGYIPDQLVRAIH